MADEKKSFKECLKIYVVDDSELSRTSMINILEDDGYRVVGSSSSADDCVGKVKSDVNCFVIDVVMPEKSGIDLAKLLHEYLKDIHIIMISSLRHEHILLESISAGARDFIYKPFDPQELLDSVEKIALQVESDSKIG